MGEQRRRWIVLVVGIALAIVGCRSGRPLEIGLLATLTGPGSEPGVISRDAALLAADELNAAGGIDGRPIELVVADTGGTVEGADERVRSFINRGVTVIVGPMLSAMTPVVSAHSDAPVLFVSPLVSTPVMTGIHDNFIRVSPGADLQATAIAAAVLEANARRVCIVVDGSNALYSVELAAIVRRELDAAEIAVAEKLDIHATTLTETADAIAADAPDAVVFATNGYSAGIIAQELAERGSEPRFFGAHWTATSDFIVHGGRAVEGAVLTSNGAPKETTPELARFIDAFRVRYGREPEPLAENAYEAMGIVTEALRRVGDASPKALRDEIIAIGGFDGLRGPIVIDEFGDPRREVSLVTVREGRFRTVIE